MRSFCWISCLVAVFGTSGCLWPPPDMSPRSVTVGGCEVTVSTNAWGHMARRLTLSIVQRVRKAEDHFDKAVVVVSLETLSGHPVSRSLHNAVFTQASGKLEWRATLEGILHTGLESPEYLFYEKKKYRMHVAFDTSKGQRFFIEHVVWVDYLSLLRH